MTNEEHLAILGQGVAVWNVWREVNPDVLPDLKQANLSGADLFGALLFGPRLNAAVLFGANLSGADLI